MTAQLGRLRKVQITPCRLCGRAPQLVVTDDGTFAVECRPCDRRSHAYATVTAALNTWAAYQNLPFMPAARSDEPAMTTFRPIPRDP